MFIIPSTGFSTEYIIVFKTFLSLTGYNLLAVLLNGGITINSQYNGNIKYGQ
jgi:hypothetical protein